MLLESIEVSITVKQSVTVRNATGCDDRVNGPADDETENAQLAKVPRGLNCQILTREMNLIHAAEQSPRIIEAAIILEPTIVRAHQHAAGAAKKTATKKRSGARAAG